MSTLQIRKLQSGAFKHVDSIDGDFFLGRFNFKQEFNKAFLVEAYGAKRRQYSITEVEVFDFGGTAETFTNWTDLINRLVDLGYTGIDTNSIPSGGGVWGSIIGSISSQTDLQNELNTKLDKVTTADVEKVYIKNADGTQGMKPTSELLSEILITNASVTGTYNIDYSAGDVWDLTLTGNTTLTESNAPGSGTTKTITLEVSGNFTLSYPSSWTSKITGAYSGTATLNTITIQTFGSKRKVLIVQPT